MQNPAGRYVGVDVHVVPLPSVLSIRMVPPMLWTMDWQIDRPKTAPLSLPAQAGIDPIEAVEDVREMLTRNKTFGAMVST
jgi:hypothetical protein